ncbi:MAG: GNAT family N-acetyltransferase [Acidobacteriota bacterium]|nr:GNAT family N-acetyltransferase [Acidobacteriota bacterium]
MEFNLRAASDADREFLYTLHCRTMRGVIEATWRWDESWQRRDFDRRFDSYQVSVIQSGGEAAGGLLLESTVGGIHIHEVQLLPEYQGQGIGTAVVRGVIDQAAQRGVPVTLSVVPANPRAQSLYERLGFAVTKIENPFIQMRVDPPTARAV